MERRKGPRHDLPVKLKQPLMRHLQKVKLLHEEDLADGYGEVFLPYTLARKYPNAPKQWGWHTSFPRLNDRLIRAAERSEGITFPTAPYRPQSEARFAKLR